MKALIFDGKLGVKDIPRPERKPGEVLIKVSRAGICNTDHEILRGYVPGFRGVLGHEFIGHVAESDDPAFLGRRVTGEINIACGECEFCMRGLGRHCPSRTVLGISNKDGAFAQYVTLPAENVIEVPPDIPDSHAIFIEPLAAALEILEQVRITREHSVLLIGDGKLAMLIALVLHFTGCCLTVLGKHRQKLNFLEEQGVPTVLLSDFKKTRHDVVVEASGNPSGFILGMECVKPRGTLVLKSTYSEPFSFNPFPVVVNELTVVGSRCGRFEAAIFFLQVHRPPIERLISAEFDLADASAAFEYSAWPDTLKVVFRVP